MHRYRPRRAARSPWLFSGLVAVSVIAACSSDDDSSGTKQVSTASGAGAGGGSAGNGGGGAAPTCDACGQQSCSDELDACSGDSACEEWLACVVACTEKTCAQGCNDEHAAAAALYAGIYGCLCTSCDASCPALDACSVCVDDAPLPLLAEPPEKLSETGLYSDIAAGILAAGVRDFEPEYPLWSDGAEKARHAYIPKCSTIDTSDMDHWEMPVGSRFWKEFSRNGVRVETRLIHRFGPGPDDWIFAAYHWNPEQTEATHVPDGLVDASGTPHDIPNGVACKKCHQELSERVLGFSAIQLSHDRGATTIATLSAEGKLTVPAPDGFTIPGDDKARAALGYLHANCGNCHNETGVPQVDMRLRVLTSATSVGDTDTFVSAVGVPTTNFLCDGFSTCPRISPGDPAGSAVIVRMSSRGTGAQMPPLATEVVDDSGVSVVSAWISTL